MKLNYNVSLEDIFTKNGKHSNSRGMIREFLSEKNVVAELEWKSSYSSTVSARTSLMHTIKAMGITNIRIISRGQRLFLVKGEDVC